VSEVPAGSLADVPAGRPGLRVLGGVRVVLARVGERVYAVGDSCAHRGGPLSEGRLAGARLTCPWHGWSYDVRTGQCAFPPRGGPVASYPVRQDGDQLWVQLP